jgi:hypothetical protein
MDRERCLKGIPLMDRERRLKGMPFVDRERCLKGIPLMDRQHRLKLTNHIFLWTESAASKAYLFMDRERCLKGIPLIDRKRRLKGMKNRKRCPVHEPGKNGGRPQSCESLGTDRRLYARAF